MSNWQLLQLYWLNFVLQLGFMIYKIQLLLINDRWKWKHSECNESTFANEKDSEIFKARSAAHREERQSFD